MATTSREERRRQGLRYLIAAGAMSLVIVGLLIALRPSGTPLGWMIRAAALLGYWAIFLAVISSAYTRELFQLLGHPFIKLHHGVALSGLILVTLHPLGVALRSSSLGVFVPAVSSLDAFLRLGGRPAWYLLGIAALAAAMRVRMKRSWRIIHYLTYAAFLLATVHAVMIGSDFVSPVMQALAIALAAVVAVSFARKRIKRQRATGG